jgi:hypothetical protein
MDTKTQTQLVHLACVLTIALCLTLAFTVLKPYPEAAGTLLVLAAFVYGKLGFKPANPVLARIIEQLAPAQLQAMSQRPPAPLATVVASESVEKGQLVVIDRAGMMVKPVPPIDVPAASDTAKVAK